MSTPFESAAALRVERILATVDSIPRGRVSTYGRIAKEAGLGRAARQVGAVLRDLPKGREIPWHRVVNASGQISQRPGASCAKQRALLEAEGIEFSHSGRIDLARFVWPDLEPGAPR